MKETNTARARWNFNKKSGFRRILCIKAQSTTYAEGCSILKKFASGKNDAPGYCPLKKAACCATCVPRCSTKRMV
jgi:hypothetical protein